MEKKLKIFPQKQCILVRFLDTVFNFLINTIKNRSKQQNLQRLLLKYWSCMVTTVNMTSLWVYIVHHYKCLHDALGGRLFRLD
jgi:hypothetical protein